LRNYEKDEVIFEIIDILKHISFDFIIISLYKVIGLNI
jgi:hypothetical protein